MFFVNYKDKFKFEFENIDDALNKGWELFKEVKDDIDLGVGDNAYYERFGILGETNGIYPTLFLTDFGRQYYNE